jgi:hypothetical protein
MATKTQLTSDSIKGGEVKTADIACSAVNTARLGNDAVVTGKIDDGVVSADDLSSTLDLSSKTVTLADNALNTQHFNVALLGFKMAVNENLTVFNLVDGVVDEFHDESGTDEGEGSNDLYNSSDDYYINSTQPDGNTVVFTAGFALATVTEADTSTAGSHPGQGQITSGTYTVPTGITSVEGFLIGAAGGGSAYNGANGGYTKGALAVTAGQSLHVHNGEGGQGPGEADVAHIGGGGGRGGHPGYGSPGGGGTFLAAAGGPSQGPIGVTAPQIYLAAGGGAGGADGSNTGYGGGDIGGVTGGSGGPTESPSGQTNANGQQGGGGDQEQGGQAASSGTNPGAESGSFLKGGDAVPSGGGGGGGGYYGGGAGSRVGTGYGKGGGGSGYVGHPQITSGDTISAAAPDGVDNFFETESTIQPAQAQTALRPLSSSAQQNTAGNMVAGEGATGSPDSPGAQQGGDGFTFLLAGLPAAATSTTIVSNAFTAQSAPSLSRIVVFQENVDTPTLNTDVIASVSRDGGSNFTNVTLVDEGYVTGASGQRVLAGLVDISGQPSGTSMRWKLALANNQVKVHGVSLAWA